MNEPNDDIGNVARHWMNRYDKAEARIRELEAELGSAKDWEVAARAADVKLDAMGAPVTTESGIRLSIAGRIEFLHRQSEAQLAECETAFMAGKTKHEFDDANNAHTECPHDAGTNARHWWTRGYSYSARMLRAMEAEADAARLRAALEMVEYVPDAAEGMEGWKYCPWCEEMDNDPHADDCARQLALSPDARQPESDAAADESEAHD